MNSHNLSEEDPVLLQKLYLISTDFVSLYSEALEQKKENNRLRDLEIERCRETQKIVSRELDDFQCVIDGKRVAIKGNTMKYTIAAIYRQMQEKSSEPLDDNWPAFVSALLFIVLGG